MPDANEIAKEFERRERVQKDLGVPARPLTGTFSYWVKATFIHIDPTIQSDNVKVRINDGVVITEDVHGHLEFIPLAHGSYACFIRDNPDAG